MPESKLNVHKFPETEPVKLVKASLPELSGKENFTGCKLLASLFWPFVGKIT